VTKKIPTTYIESFVAKHYWHAVSFLVIIILFGAGFWGLRRFSPALFLGKPDLIAVPNEELPEQKKQQPVQDKPPFLNINTASSEELQSLSGIGPQMAKKIIQYREENGNFTSVEALMEVKGLGEKTLEKLKPFIGVE
jgi:comEA protein